MISIEPKRFKFFCLLVMCLSVFFASFYFLPYSPYTGEIKLMISTICWFLSGISLFFSTGIKFGWVKVLIILVNWFCIFGWWFSTR
ncbi:hypothetical protein CUS89_00365 [Enterococcus mundtii]|uniref:Uncharacterized protein n=1 Tax=Enterococcus mundtii TaxID=53346 RepID=A0A2S7RZU6_ENTMU|nr:hypothetical protein CUS89_00365 [Enterococcus mundtii]